jgi:hypothetical protein
MDNYEQINKTISERNPCTSFEENTYYTMPLFEHFCDHLDYKYVTIFGYYKNKYNWTNEQALDMYNKAPDRWIDGTGVERLYDWGRGVNKLVKDADRDWHEPHLDHIVPRSKGGTNDPTNFQVLPRILNVVLSNLTDEAAPAIIPLLIQQFPSLTAE